MREKERERREKKRKEKEKERKESTEKVKGRWRLERVERKTPPPYRCAVVPPTLPPCRRRHVHQEIEKKVWFFV